MHIREKTTLLYICDKQTRQEICYVLLTVDPSIFILVINQIDAKEFVLQ
jgi:hypothetical protein